MSCQGLDLTAEQLVSKQLQKGNHKKADQIYIALKIVSMLIIFINSSLMYAFHNIIVCAFTSNQKLVAVAAHPILLVCLNTMLDSYKGMLKGIAKAHNIQK